MDARFVLLDRHRDELPKFTVVHDVKGTDRFAEAYDQFRAEIEPLEDAITADLTAAHDAARDQFHTGQLEWLATINDAITAAGISEADIEAQRKWFQAQEAKFKKTTSSRKKRP